MESRPSMMVVFDSLHALVALVAVVKQMNVQYLEPQKDETDGPGHRSTAA